MMCHVGSPSNDVFHAGSPLTMLCFMLAVHRLRCVSCWQSIEYDVFHVGNPSNDVFHVGSQSTMMCFMLAVHRL